MKRKLKILSYLDNESGRDVEMMLPLHFFAEHVLGCEVKMCFVLDYHQIYLEQPDIVMVPNLIGSHLYLEATKYAHQYGVKIFALESEGNFDTTGSFDMWSINRERKIYQEFVCCWSERVRNHYLKEVPDDAEKVVLTGGTYFDQYLNYPLTSKTTYFKKHCLDDYKNVVCYAGWSFGSLAFERGRKNFSNWIGGDDKLYKVHEKREEIESILRDCIVDNPDTLFVLKEHPKEVFQTEDKSLLINEMTSLRSLPNVYYTGNDSSIKELIDIADLWLGFESTTCMEAWLRSKPSCIIRGKLDFPDSYKKSGFGSSQPVVYDSIQLSEYVKEVSSTGNLKAFNTDEMHRLRQEILANAIGYTDGLNHVRAGFYLKKVVDELNKKERETPHTKLNMKHLFYHLLIRVGLIVYNRSLFSQWKWASKFIWLFEEYTLVNAKRLQAEYNSYLEPLYKKLEIAHREDLEQFLFDK